MAEEPVTPEAAAETKPAVEKLPPAPSSLGQLTPERLMALRTYKAQRLQVRAETEYRGSSVATYTSMSYGYPSGMGTGVVVTDQLSTFRTWGVYRGPQRLSTPDFLNLTGAQEQKNQLVNDIHTLRRQAKGWYSSPVLAWQVLWQDWWEWRWLMTLKPTPPSIWSPWAEPS